jgi:hypothetical protein
MVISGISMTIFDSRIIHNAIRTIKTRFQNNQQDEHVELGEGANLSEGVLSAGERQSESELIRVTNETAVSRRNQQSQDQQDDIEKSASRVGSDEIKMPYSILTGVAIFSLFVVSFILIMVIRAVVPNTPIAYRFFSNMYLAGTSQGFSRMLSYFRNHYIRS